MAEAKRVKKVSWNALTEQWAKLPMMMIIACQMRLLAASHRATPRRCILTTLRTSIPSLNGWHATSIFFQVLRRLLPFLFGQPSITLWQWGSKGAALCNYILWHFCIQFARSHRKFNFFFQTQHKSLKEKTEPIFVIMCCSFFY